MKRIRFAGVVSFANQLQREFSRPTTTERRDRVRISVQRLLEQVATALEVHGAHLQAIPGPTRRAIEFLQNFDFASVPISEQPTTYQPLESLSIAGLTSSVEKTADCIEIVGDRVLVHIQNWVATLDARHQRAGHRPDHFTPRTRELLGWMRFMADAENFADYRAALTRAKAIFEQEANAEQWPRPMSVHFRPTRSLFRVRVVSGETRCLLPTPVISLDDAGFTTLARAMFGRRRPGRGAALHALTLGEAYQELQAELASLGGIVEDTRGLAHDLAASFARVNAEYFAGAMPRPRLTWNQSITAGKFGHYNFASDTVMISRALDRHDVPEIVVDHVMHHELLHKKHGLRWHAGRGHAHTPEFRDEERRFARYEDADEFLKRLNLAG